MTSHTDALREAAERVCSWGENARIVLHEGVASGKSIDPEQALQLSAVWRDIDALRAALSTREAGAVSGE